MDFFPDFTVEEGETTIRNITIKDLMTMTAPYKHQEDPYLEYFTRDDWVSTALELLGGPEKAGKFRYTPLIRPDILSGILVKATGMSVLDFTAEHLFSPLGISVGGKWNGKQIVSAQWIAESTREHSRWEELNLPYGYLWWIIDEHLFLPKMQETESILSKNMWSQCLHSPDIEPPVRSMIEHERRKDAEPVI